MNNEEFNKILDDITVSMKKVLAGKAEEYATDVDRLHNFKVAAELQGVTMRQALGGMMAKHTVSVYDLIRADELATPEMWAEKLGDHLNYLVLLAAIVEEERSLLTRYEEVSADEAPRYEYPKEIGYSIHGLAKWAVLNLTRDRVEVMPFEGHYRARYIRPNGEESGWFHYPTIQAMSQDLMKAKEHGEIK